MDLSPALQFYAPIVGIIALAYWSGVLAARVKHLEKDVFNDASRQERAGDHDRLVIVEATVTNIHDDVVGIKRSIDGMQRQLGNLMTGKSGAYEVHGT